MVEQSEGKTGTLGEKNYPSVMFGKFKINHMHNFQLNNLFYFVYPTYFGELPLLRRNVSMLLHKTL
jgi:hypothetical protein